MFVVLHAKSYRKALKRLSRIKSFDIHAVERVVVLLASGKMLPSIHHDHPLVGHMKGLRECHIRNDLLLVYQIKKCELVLVLIDLGTHQDIFGD